MKKIIRYIPFLSFALLLTACEINDPFYHETDYQPPAPPTGIYVLNGDNVVDITWDHNRENDVAGYNVYYAYSYDGKYTLIGSSEDNYFVDYDAVNGVTYYYAVTAYDYNSNESDLSYDVIYTTPRPEGYNQTIFDYLEFPNNSGYSFDEYRVVPYDDLSSDFFFENYQGTFYLNVWDDTDIQDMGLTNDIYDIPYAPETGWVPEKYVKARIGHTYVLWTWDNHFAKIRVTNITPQRVVFDWAYQTVEGNPTLKRNVPDEREAFDKSKMEERRDKYNRNEN